jgi:hypothetical protein
MTRSLITLPVLLALAAAPAAAQDIEEQPRRVRAHAGLGFVVAQPVGEFDEFIDAGFGGAGHFIFNVDRAGIFGVRADAGFIIYGHERYRACLSPTIGCRIEVDVTTTNDIAFASIGPQLTLPAGPVRPYVNGSVGIAYFATRSSVSGVDDSEEDFGTTNFDDATFAWQAGTGVRVPLGIGRVPLSIDIGARYNTNGRVDYLREGDIVDNPDGSITLRPQRSDANLVTYVIGASIAVRW